MLKFSTFQIKYKPSPHGNNFYQKALGNCYGLKLPKYCLQFKKKITVIYYYFRHTFVPYGSSRLTRYDFLLVFYTDLTFSWIRCH